MEASACSPGTPISTAKQQANAYKLNPSMREHLGPRLFFILDPPFTEKNKDLHTFSRAHRQGVVSHTPWLHPPLSPPASASVNVLSGMVRATQPVDEVRGRGDGFADDAGGGGEATAQKVP
ncbi:hypothetical protein ACR6C2_26685 [Streptomyces sp. INA 01156]